MFAKSSEIRWTFVVAAVTLVWAAPLLIQAVADDLFQLAVNYVFTGRTDPPTLLKLWIENPA